MDTCHVKHIKDSYMYIIMHSDNIQSYKSFGKVNILHMYVNSN